MNIKPNIFKVALIFAGAIIASAIMLKFTENTSWMAFVGWIIFYLSIQLPLFYISQNSSESCTTWFSRLFDKG